MKRRRTDESIPLGLRQLEFSMRMNRLLKWRANFFVRFFTIFCKGVIRVGVVGDGGGSSEAGGGVRAVVLAAAVEGGRGPSA